MNISPIYSSTKSRWVRSFCIRGDSHVDRLQEPSTPYLSPIVIGSKSSPVYNAHTYHTKVPPEVIEQFILQFTKPGDTVLDPFCGSGMTGVAALKHGRRAILIDLSPFATFLAYNHCVPVDPIAFKEALDRISSEVRERVAWLYETVCRTCQSHAQIEKMLWCEVVSCPTCSAELRLWDVALNSDIRVTKAFVCPHCGAKSQRGKAKRIGWKPVQMDVSCPHCGRDTVEPGALDAQKLHAIEAAPIPPTLWHPVNPVRWGDMWRRGYHEGIQTVADFYTKRNLWALAYLFTNVVWLGRGCGVSTRGEEPGR